MPAEEEEAAAGGPRLCGYLQKLSGKGPLRAFRSRWFAFDARRCALCYYKGPREAQPLGRLELARAAFRLHDPPAPGPGPGQQPQPAEEERRAEENGAPGTAFEVRGPGGDVAVLRVSGGAGGREGTGSSAGPGRPGCREQSAALLGAAGPLGGPPAAPARRPFCGRGGGGRAPQSEPGVFGPSRAGIVGVSSAPFARGPLQMPPAGSHP